MTRRRRRQIFVGAAVLAVCAVAAALLATRSSDGASTVLAAQPAAVRAALITRLQQSHLRYSWVVCIRTGRVFRRHDVVRCNVNFGDPHIEAYCSVLKSGRLLTDHDDHAIPCRHDDAGPAATIVHS